jgi:hypothetical protein
MREDVTAAYLVIDVERLREPMQKITDRFLELMELKVSQPESSAERYCIPDYFLYLCDTAAG